MKNPAICYLTSKLHANSPHRSYAEKCPVYIPCRQVWRIEQLRQRPQSKEINRIKTYYFAKSTIFVGDQRCRDICFGGSQPVKINNNLYGNFFQWNAADIRIKAGFCQHIGETLAQPEVCLSDGQVVSCAVFGARIQYRDIVPVKKEKMAHALLYWNRMDTHSTLVILGGKK